MNEVHGFVGNSKEKETKNNDNSKNHKKSFCHFLFILNLRNALWISDFFYLCVTNLHFLFNHFKYMSI